MTPGRRPLIGFVSTPRCDRTGEPIRVALPRSLGAIQLGERPCALSQSMNRSSHPSIGRPCVLAPNPWSRVVGERIGQRAEGGGGHQADGGHRSSPGLAELIAFAVVRGVGTQPPHVTVVRFHAICVVTGFRESCDKPLLERTGHLVAVTRSVVVAGQRGEALHLDDVEWGWNSSEVNEDGRMSSTEDVANPCPRTSIAGRALSAS